MAERKGTGGEHAGHAGKKWRISGDGLHQPCLAGFRQLSGVLFRRRVRGDEEKKEDEVDAAHYRFADTPRVKY